MSKLIISCEDNEAITMALLDRDVLDHLPTDQKYTQEMEDVLFNEYGYGFLSPEDKKKYVDIPDYISEEDIFIWESEKDLYEASLSWSYPEAKEYVFTRNH